MIRLSTAHARARLSKNVEAQDANCAVELVQFAYFKKVLEKPKKRKREEDGNDEEEEEAEMEVDGEEIRPSQTRKTKRERRSDDPYEFEEESGDEGAEVAKESQTGTASKTDSFIKLSEERLKQFRSFLFKEFRKTHAQSLPLQQIYESAEKETELNFTKQEIESALNTMQEDLNQIFVSNNIVILV